jgi:hypothetical protein
MVWNIRGAPVLHLFDTSLIHHIKLAISVITVTNLLWELLTRNELSLSFDVFESYSINTNYHLTNKVIKISTKYLHHSVIAL